MCAGLPESVRGCMVYMGAQRPKDHAFECDKRGRFCQRSQGTLPVRYNISEGEPVESDPEKELPEAATNFSLATCIASCTVARDCNYITYQIATNTTGECASLQLAVHACCTCLPETKRNRWNNLSLYSGGAWGALTPFIATAGRLYSAVQYSETSLYRSSIYRFQAVPVKFPARKP